MSGWTYIMASGPYGTLCRRTADLAGRAWKQREGLGWRFCARYRVHRLVHAEPFGEIGDAIHWGKRLKKWPRSWKIQLIERDNPNWDDLYDRLNC